MATFSKTTFKTLNYNSFRPHYPASFYKTLENFVKSENLVERIQDTLDIGCGTGIATYDLLNISDRVEGIDHSATMVETCNKLKTERYQQLGITDESRIKFSVGNLDHLPEGKSYDLITAAQCLHWCKDFPKFFEEAYTRLNTNGVLSYWYYVDPFVTDFEGSSKFDKPTSLKKVNEIYMKYAYNDPDLLGPHWEQPGRDLIKNFYKGINKDIPQKLYKDITIDSYSPASENFSLPDESKNLSLVKEDISVLDIQNYLSTYSAYHNFISLNPKSTLLDDYVKEVYDTLGWSDDTKITLVWNTGYSFLRKND